MRRIAAAGVALLLVLLAVLRAASPSPDTLIRQGVGRLTGAELTLDYADAGFDWFRGLRLRDVRIEGSDWTLSADWLVIDMRLLPLLRGEFSPQDLHLTAPHLWRDPARGLPLPPPAALEGVERIALVKGRWSLPGGRSFMENVQLDMRGWGRRGTVRWELQASAGGSINGHGEATLAAGEIRDAFAKLRVERLPRARIAAVAPPPAAAAPVVDRFDRVSGSLTFDLQAPRLWTTFGELTLHAAESRDVTVRGKLEHDPERGLRWRESYVHLSPETILALEGECPGTGTCAGRVSVERASLPDLARLAPALPIGVRGSVDAETELRCGKERCDAVGKARLSGLLLAGERGNVRFPPLILNWEGLSLLADGTVELAALDVARADESGSVRVGEARLTGSGLSAQIGLEGSESVWVPLANTGLLLAGKAPVLRGGGRLDGALRLDARTADVWRLRGEIDAGRARLTVPGVFDKPGGVTAHAEGSWRQRGEAVRAGIDAATLNGSRLAQLAWRRNGTEDAMEIGDVSIDFDALRGAGVALPPALEKLRGAVRGGADFTDLPSTDEPLRWFAAARGAFDLRDFGRGANVWSGRVRCAGGRIESAALRWVRGDQTAELSGHLIPDAGRGELDIRNSRLDLEMPPALPAWLRELTLRGRLEGGEVDTLGNRWDEVRADYRWSDGELLLEDLFARVAGGRLTSERLRLRPGATSLRLSGPLRLTAARLSALRGPEGWLGVRMRGRLFVNLFLEGTLPVGTEWPFRHDAAWRGNGDVAVFGGRWIATETAPGLLAPLLGGREAGTPRRFDRLSLRLKFREEGLRLPRLDLEAGRYRYLGEGEIDAEGNLEGRVTRRDGSEARREFRLEGHWPEIRLTPERP